MRGSSFHRSLCTCGVVCPIPHQKNTSSSLMSHPNLLGLHPESFTSFCSTAPQPPQTACSTKPERGSLTGIWTHLRATSLEGQSGYLADSIPLAGYEPKTCIDVRSEPPAERTASTLRITSLPQSQRARPPTVFRSKRQPTVAHNFSQQVCVFCALSPVLPSISRCLRHFLFIRCHLLGAFSLIFCGTRKVCFT